jgi:3',5'-cyclic AMP phosphodiesterase CpdA
MTPQLDFALAQISDAHLRIDDDGGDSLRALEAAAGAVAALAPVPDALLISGDLVDTGSPREYERARELLARLAMPIHVVAGNHDDRDALVSCFGAPCAGDGLVQYATRVGSHRLVVCDSVLPGRNEGSFGPDRRAWLVETLAAEPGTPTVLAMHHAPLRTGIRVIDEVGLPAADLEALREVIDGNPQVVRILAGHLHRTIVGALGRCGVFVCPSANFQLRLSTAFGDRVVLAREPASIGLHVIHGGEILTHVQPIGDYDVIE